jgi:hypothetical protein
MDDTLFEHTSISSLQITAMCGFVFVHNYASHSEHEWTSLFRKRHVATLAREASHGSSPSLNKRRQLTHGAITTLA